MKKIHFLISCSEKAEQRMNYSMGSMLLRKQRRASPVLFISMEMVLPEKKHRKWSCFADKEVEHQRQQTAQEFSSPDIGSILVKCRRTFQNVMRANVKGSEFVLL